MSYICGRCIHIEVCLVPRSTGCVEYCKSFKKNPEMQPQTNFDRITKSPEVLAKWLADEALVPESHCDEWVRWFKQESKE